MFDPLQNLRARAAIEGSSGGDEARPVKVGFLAPFPVWIATTLVVRLAQILFLVCCAWYLAALFDAMDKSHTTSTPPGELWLATIIIGTSSGRSSWPWRTSPFGDFVGKLLASQECPACGQNIFNHTPPSGYAPPSLERAIFPSRICTNCKRDLTRRTVD